MTKPNSPKKSSPRPPTLHLDVHQARRENDQAIIIPIIYDPPESARRIAKPDETIIPIPFLASSIAQLPPAVRPAEPITPPLREDATAPQASPIANPIPSFLAGQFHPDSVYIMPSGAAFQRTHHLSIAVPLLLLAGIAVVVFAWVAFR